MADPITLAAIGAVGGAALKPSNPLQGAMLGGIAGFTGGTALGVGAAGSAGTAGSGLAMGSGGATGLTAGTGAGLSAGTGAGLSAGGSTIGLGAGTTAGLSAASAATPLASTVPGASYSLAAAPTMGNYSLVAPSAVSSVPAPSFMDKLAMSGKSAYENPMMTASALNATQGLLTPEQQPPSAPAVPIQARGQLKDYNPMASMDPYRQSVIGGQPISLI
jgi:hypothetical protein